MTYNIVINNSLLNSIKTINIFKIDLGRSILNKKTFKREFNDDFVENYTEMNKRIIHKCGSIGSITFYVDTLVENNILLIYADNILYDVEYDGSEMKSFISKIIKKIDEHNLVSHSVLPKSERKKVEMWIANDEKNKNKSYDIDQTLSHDDYLQKMLDRKNA